MSDSNTTKYTESEARLLCLDRCGGSCIGTSALATPEETEAAIHAACWNWRSFLNYEPPTQKTSDPPDFRWSVISNG